MAALGACPQGIAAGLGRFFGALVFALAAKERRKTLRQIEIGYPQSSPQERLRLARAVWAELGRKIFETVPWLHWPQARIAAQAKRSTGWEHLDKALARGKGALVVTAHLGHWELLAATLASRVPVSAVAQKLYDPRFDALMTRFREKNLGVSMIKRGMALRGILEALKARKVVIMLCDQDSGKDGVFTPFFGKPAFTQSGAARIALKTGAALVPAFMPRGADGFFELQVEKEIPLAQGADPEKNVLETTRRYTEVIEAQVRAYPDQWVWMHERWKTRPPGEAS